jgi:hypothetical protein
MRIWGVETGNGKQADPGCLTSIFSGRQADFNTHSAGRTWLTRKIVTTRATVFPTGLGLGNNKFRRAVLEA